MATKKQKRAAGLAKREEFMAGVRQAGLAAQQADREERKKDRERIAAEARVLNNRLTSTRVRIAMLAGVLEARREDSTQS
jgi:hypothetical protein